MSFPFDDDSSVYGLLASAVSQVINSLSNDIQGVHGKRIYKYKSTEFGAGDQKLKVTPAIESRFFQASTPGSTDAMPALFAPYESLSCFGEDLLSAFYKPLMMLALSMGYALKSLSHGMAAVGQIPGHIGNYIVDGGSDTADMAGESDESSNHFGLAISNGLCALYTGAIWFTVDVVVSWASLLVSTAMTLIEKGIEFGIWAYESISDWMNQEGEVGAGLADATHAV